MIGTLSFYRKISRNRNKFQSKEWGVDDSYLLSKNQWKSKKKHFSTLHQQGMADDPEQVERREKGVSAIEIEEGKKRKGKRKKKEKEEKGKRKRKDKEGDLTCRCRHQGEKQEKG